MLNACSTKRFLVKLQNSFTTYVWAYIKATAVKIA